MSASYNSSSWEIVLIFFIVIGANVGLAFIPAYMAKNKGYSFGAFWCIGFFASFIIGIIIAACIPEKVPPYYAPPQYQPYGQPYPQYEQTHRFERYCSKCGHGLRGGDPFCPGCGTNLQQS